MHSNLTLKRQLARISQTRMAYLTNTSPHIVRLYELTGGHTFDLEHKKTLDREYAKL